MKYTFTLLLLSFSLALKAQTPQCTAYHIPNSTNPIQLNISNLKPGVYRLLLYNANGTSSVSFIKQ